ncbi:MAG: cobyric acid synthase [Neomegalonema sp.]|nr:cobyric acid synthase [Neomegalonema sp.]
MSAAPALMIQGAGSNVGKSLLVAGLCRAAVRRGLRVAPFKPQNMSNNAAATPEGGEIGRAQALQARASGRAPHTDMNPVLLKPESDRGAQVILQGRRLATVKARDYAALKPKLMPAVLESFRRLAQGADLVLVEGAGSPAEINLRAGDIANMGFARAADVPVVLVGDIDRGGVIAQLVGTRTVLDPADSAQIRGFIVNKFRGDPSLFDDGLRAIERMSGWRSYGVAPWFASAQRLPAEDSQDLLSRARAGRDGAKLVVAAPLAPRVANFDDLDPLAAEPNVDLRLIRAGEPLPGDADWIIIPGAKSTVADLAAFRAQGWDVDLHAHIRRGGRVLGLCGGYQMLGRKIHDPEGVEGVAGTVDGLGWLDIETVMSPDKRVAPVSGRHIASGAAVSGYEIHLGRSHGVDCARPLFDIDGRAEGAQSRDERIMGSYLHGVFGEDAFRRVFLADARSDVAYEAQLEETLDALADHLEAHLDMSGLLALAAR